MCERPRPDPQSMPVALCTRVRALGHDDWRKLVQLVKFMAATKDDVLTLSMGEITALHNWVDASFAVHPDCKSHGGLVSIMKGGKGAILSGLEKQKLNTDSGTVAELAGTHQFSWRIVSAVVFLECQGHKAQENVLHQDNKSAILLEKNGCTSVSKRTRAVNVRHFQIKDYTDEKQLEIKCCRTDDMIGDYVTKRLQGYEFSKFRKAIMGME